VKKFMFSFVGASMLLAASASAASWTGTISDAHCGAKHTEGTEADAKCVSGCVKKGAAPVFVSDGKVYTIDEASRSKVDNLLGKKVKVNGTMEGDTITIKSVKAES